MALLPKTYNFPGVHLALAIQKIFERSDSENSYHSFIERNYGTNVVTASIHINLGIEIYPYFFRPFAWLDVRHHYFLH